MLVSKRRATMTLRSSRSEQGQTDLWQRVYTSSGANATALPAPFCVLFPSVAHLLKSFLSEAKRQAELSQSTTPDEPLFAFDPLILPVRGLAEAAMRETLNGEGFTCNTFTVRDKGQTLHAFTSLVWPCGR